MRTIKECHDEILATNREILELKTQLFLLESKKDRLIKEHNEIVMNAQQEE